MTNGFKQLQKASRGTNTFNMYPRRLDSIKTRSNSIKNINQSSNDIKRSQITASSTKQRWSTTITHIGAESNNDGTASDKITQVQMHSNNSNSTNQPRVKANQSKQSLTTCTKSKHPKNIKNLQTTSNELK